MAQGEPEPRGEVGEEYNYAIIRQEGSVKTARRKLEAVPFTQVRFPGGFWHERQETNRTASLPHMHQMMEKTGRLSVFDLQFERAVPSAITDIFGDADASTWLEAASLTLATTPDEELRTLVEGVIDRVLPAQEPDGYLNTHFTHVQPEMRWKNLRDWHELYCAGHFIEAAVAHHLATGETRLLGAMERFADLIGRVFGPKKGQKRGYPGHPEIELALVKLFQATGKKKYLDLAAFFLAERGTEPHYYDREARERGEDPAQFWAHSYEYCQAHKPIREQEKVVGHAVRAMYLFSAAADIAHEKNDLGLLEACRRLWSNLIERRMYLTGGIGPSRFNEGFTRDYDLPDESAYAETCATIGLVFWNARLLQVEGDGRYADALERGLYNGALSGVALDGKHFHYENPLSSDGSRHRQSWFACPCCPPNIMRLIAQVGGYFHSTSRDGFWVHLYGESEADLTVRGTALHLKQDTGYPYDGKVKLTLAPAQPLRCRLHLRIPGWCKRYRVTVNGKPLHPRRGKDGYIVLAQTWNTGDEILLELDMPVRLTWANPAVRQLQGRVAIERGPLVYCLEGTDNGGSILDQYSLDARLFLRGCRVRLDDKLLGGCAVIEGPARRIQGADATGALYPTGRPEEREMQITAIPYALWDNREAGEMRVWLRARSGGR